MYILRHSCAHLLAQAVSELYPNAKPTIGPPVENGFYYDFAMENIGEDDLRLIEKKMEELCRKNLKLQRVEYSQEELKELYHDNPYKLEIINEKIGEGTGSTVYQQGDWYDLCLGPHVPSTSNLMHF